ncbi:hypothetical protein Trydic_g7511 [Trypoxylus dichotomus]
MIYDVYLEWSSSELYYVLSAFYLGYTLSHVFSGMLSDLYGAKYIFCGSLLGCAIMSIIMTYTLKLSWFYSAIVEGLLGVLQGIAMPAIFSLLSRWLPNDHKTILLSYGFSGGCLGSLLNGVLSAYFVKIKNWEGLFYCWAGLTFVCCIPLTIFIYSSPAVHPWVSAQERAVLKRDLGTAQPKRIPLKAIIHDSAVWAIAAAEVGHNYSFITLDTYLPRILSEIAASDFTADITAFILIYSFQWISALSFGYLGNNLIRRRHVPTIYLRCFFGALGNIVPSIISLLTLYVGCNSGVIIGFLTMAQICKGAVIPGILCNVLDITIHYAGVVYAIQNCVGAIFAMIIPPVVGRIVQQQVIEEWRKVFWLVTGISLFTTVYFLIFCKGERAWWDVIEEDSEETSEDSSF